MRISAEKQQYVSSYVNASNHNFFVLTWPKLGEQKHIVIEAYFLLWKETGCWY